MNETETDEFTSKGFLSSFIDQRVQEFRRKLSAGSTDFDRLNQFAHSILGRCRVVNRDPIKLLALSALSRAIENFQAARLLAERGMDKQSKSAQRSLLEDTFVIATCANDPSTAENYVKADEGQRRKRINSLLNIPESRTHLSADQILELKKQQELLGQQHAQGLIPEVTFAQLADKGRLTRLFELHYRFLSMFSHPSPSGMADDLLRDDNGSISQVIIGPNYHDADSNLSTATFVMIMALVSANSLFDLANDSEIQSFLEERDSLNAT